MLCTFTTGTEQELGVSFEQADGDTQGGRARR
jgi:hypothetical protein